jgi:uncharacterized protein with HEPN domain
MSKRNDLVPMGDMLDLGRRVIEKIRIVNKEQFDADENLRITVMHLIQTIGEAARRVSDEGRQAHPDIEWPEIVGMRNRLVHDYTNIDFDAVWRAATIDVPRLVILLETFMPSEPP